MNYRILILFLVICSNWTCLIGAGKIPISVTQFGAIPDDTINDAKALRQAVAYCKAHKGITLFSRRAFIITKMKKL